MKFEPQIKISNREGQGYFRTGNHVGLSDARFGRSEHALLWCDGKAAGRNITRRKETITSTACLEVLFLLKYYESDNMNGLDATSRSPLSRAIPSRRIPVHDPTHMPSDYSTTPGGTIYSTTPGGKERLSFDQFFLSANIFYHCFAQINVTQAFELLFWCFGINFICNL